MNRTVLIRRVPPLLLSFFLATTAVSQTEPSAETETPSSPTESDRGLLREQEPRVFVLRDAQGRRIYVPDFSFERWEELIKQERNLLPARPPRYDFTEDLELTGRVVGEHVELEVDCRFSLLAIRAETEAVATWHRVPLRFDHAIRSARVDHEGDGQLVMTYDETGDGHVAWVLARPGTSHRLRWQARLPLSRSGNEVRLNMLAPPAPYRLQLTIPRSSIDISVDDPDEHLFEAKAVESRTEVTVASVGGDLGIRWRDRDDVPPLLESTGEIQVGIIGEQLEWMASLTVRSYGKPVESFLVRLPQGASLVPSANPELSVTPQDVPGDEGEARVVRVQRRDGQSAAEFAVTLHAIQSPSVKPRDRAPVETAGFEVIDAVRQSGTVQFELEGDWTVDWTLGPYVRQVGGNPEPLAGENMVARFVYNRQPYSLKVRVAPQESRMSVEPTYVADVTPGDVQLEARMKFRISGGIAKHLKVAMPGWNVQRIVPEEYYTDFSLEASVLTIDLVPHVQAVVGDLELQIFATQLHEGDASTLSIQLPRPQLSIQQPRPQEAVAAPARVAILSAENVQLAPRAEEIQGLAADPRPSDMGLPPRRQLPLIYQEDTAAEQAVFVADLHIRQRSMQAAIHSNIRLAENAVDVAQILSYTIEYEPADQLLLSVPEQLLDTDQWQVSLEGTDLPVSVSNFVSRDAGDGQPLGRAMATVDLLEERLGVCQLDVQFRRPLELSQSVAKTTLTVPLVQPLENDDTAVLENTLEIYTSEYFRATVADNRWTPLAAGDQLVAAAEPLYRSDGISDDITLDLTVTQPQRQNTTYLDRVWVQTWLAGRIRRDRVVYRLLTNDAAIEIILPDDVNELEEVAVNGQRWRKFARSGNRLTVELDAVPAVRQYTLELWYFTALQYAPVGRVEVALPQLTDAQSARRIFWQLIVPRSEHLLWSPGVLTPEYLWQWSRYFWGRRPNRDQADLEQLLSASVQDPIPTSTNRYLFSSVGPLSDAAFFVAARSVLVVALSGVALGTGLLLLYLPWLRHPVAIIVGGLTILGLGLTFPEPALVAAQAATLGLVLVLVARVLLWTVGVRRYRRPLFVAPSGRLTTSEVPRAAAAESGSARLGTTVTPEYQVSGVESES